MTNCHYTAFDGNGNITALVRATDHSTSARYEYSPFGQLIRSTGVMAKNNPFRFSTKYWDDETDLVYYGYRYYSPSLGRWIGRDTAEEGGGLNLYQFVRNTSVNMFDSDGRWPSSLAQWNLTGVMADTANTLYSFSSAFIGPFSLIGQGLQANAAVLAAGVNYATSGALFRNVSGVGGFATFAAGGFGLGYARGFNRAQSLGYAVVSGRLSAVAAVGQAAGCMMRGTSFNPNSTVGMAYSLIHDSMSGNSGFADLDAALLGEGVGRDAIHDGLNNISLISSLIARDAAGAFASLPEYQAVNAWDMASSMEDGFKIQGCGAPRRFVDA